MLSNWLKFSVLSLLQCLVFTIAAAAQLTIAINGNSSTPQSFYIGDDITINCTVSSSSDVSFFTIQRADRFYKTLDKTTSGAINKTLTCDDNTSYRCYGIFNKSRLYSDRIYITIKCPPIWAESVKKPVVVYSAKASNKVIDLAVIGHPQPTSSVKKFTSTGLQDLSANVDVLSYANKVTLTFRTFSEGSHGVYQLVANNSMGTFTANITLRGNTLPPKHVIAWSTSPNSMHIEWTAGEIFKTKPKYYLYSKEVKWMNPVYVYDIGLTVTYVLSNVQPNTTYYFQVACYSPFGGSVYSNIAQGTTLNPSDRPQTKPTYQLSEVTSSNCQDESSGPVFPTFEVGIGIGIGIGLILVIIAVIGTVIYFKRSPVKRDEIPVPKSNPNTKTEMYMNVNNDIYEQLSHTNTGACYDNKGSGVRF